jgi:hypothetical protein
MDEILSLQNQRSWRTGVPFPQNSERKEAKHIAPVCAYCP